MKENRFNLIFGMAAVLSLIQDAATAGMVSGRVMSESREPLTGASVVVEGTEWGAATDLDGKFWLAALPEGTYRLRASMLGYDDALKEGVQVSADGVVAVDFILKSRVIILPGTEIRLNRPKGTEERVLEERLAATRITDALSAEVLKGLPDPDVAQAVRRSTGVSTEGGDPVIRGLGVRYSKVTLNSSQVSGTEPNRSAVSLDLFPKALLGQVTVNKSYLPDQFGEFGGGHINLSTLEIPSDSEFRFSLESGFKQNSTFQDFRSYRGGKLDFLGVDDGTRAMPKVVRDARSKIALRGMFTDYGYTVEELEKMGEAFADNWSTTSGRALPGQSYSLAYATNGKVGGAPWSLMASVLYKNNYDYSESDRNILKGGVDSRPEIQHQYRFQTWRNGVMGGGLVALKSEPSPLTTLSGSLMVNHRADDETRYFEGFNDDRAQLIRDTRLRFVQDDVVFVQVNAKQTFPGMRGGTLSGQISRSIGYRHEPDTREVQYEKRPNDPGPFVFADESQSGSRLFSRLVDVTWNSGLDWLQPLGRNLSVKVGVAALWKHRNSQTRFFQFEPRDDADVDFSQEPDELFRPENIGADGFMLREATRPTDSYAAEQRLNAGYVLAEGRPTDRLKIVGGVRWEDSRQVVTSYELFTASQTPVIGRIATLDWLPALAVTYQVRPRTNLRLAASQTVSRPDFRELSEWEFTDIIGGHAVIGNPRLTRALIRNWDLRWEQARGVGDLTALSVFYKVFVNPIETVIQPTAQNRVSFENAESASGVGVELEVRQSLATIHPRLAAWSAGMNLTLLQSSVQLSDSAQGIQTSKRRPLHGQSPYLLNVNLRCSPPGRKTEVEGFLHVFGKRISEVGSKPLPDIYELPHPEIDLSARRMINTHLELKGVARNLLDPEIQFRQGDIPIERYRKGRAFTIGLAYSR